ncbi:hypothetical protein BZA77DRAFT_293288 [Pyronema omphalodes]|nr:hypothetical protein BZA77DRAFT_293288 [Pyronema omphalodes]
MASTAASTESSNEIPEQNVKIPGLTLLNTDLQIQREFSRLSTESPEPVDPEKSYTSPDSLEPSDGIEFQDSSFTDNSHESTEFCDSMESMVSMVSNESIETIESNETNEFTESNEFTEPNEFTESNEFTTFTFSPNNDYHTNEPQLLYKCPYCLFECTDVDIALNGLPDEHFFESGSIYCNIYEYYITKIARPTHRRVEELRRSYWN